MSNYINPEGKSKLEWLKEHGEETLPVRFMTQIPEGFNLVSLIDNMLFDAALIVESQYDLDEVNRLTDPRPKRWFYVLTEDIPR